MDTFNHFKAVLGMIFGLGIATLIKGTVKFIQHPNREKPYWVHLLWCLYIFLLMVHFWWWEYSLYKIKSWEFPKYFFLIVYTGMFYVLCAFLIPEDVKEYGGDYKNYFFRRKKWFFGALALTFIADIIDTLIKGRAYFLLQDIEYPIRNAMHILLCLVAIKVTNTKFHAVLVCGFILYELSYILRLFLVE